MKRRGGGRRASEERAPPCGAEEEGLNQYFVTPSKLTIQPLQHNQVLESKMFSQSEALDYAIETLKKEAGSK